MKEVDYSILGAPPHNDEVESRALDHRWNKKDGVPEVKVCFYWKPRAIRQRLDKACGPNRWQVEYDQGPEGGISCQITIFDPELQQWIGKMDGSTQTAYDDHDWDGKLLPTRTIMKNKQDSIKGGYTTAFRRAFNPWGGDVLNEVGYIVVNCKPKYDTPDNSVGKYDPNTGKKDRQSGQWYHWHVNPIEDYWDEGEDVTDEFAGKFVGPIDTLPNDVGEPLPEVTPKPKTSRKVEYDRDDEGGSFTRLLMMIEKTLGAEPQEAIFAAAYKAFSCEDWQGCKPELRAGLFKAIREAALDKVKR